eukprot:TRINITY_DN5149_c0_g1_i2.p1 TRINITY_DN5149_c0_g1~~TRINITY_DN5149_c0_g1_i2.p1  ORF type:complete len:222 (-),score=47.51 TRINITY_DN5149_c0_g1_i2:362-1027(-)
MKAIKGISKDLDHTKTKFLQKYGSTEKTVDAQFEEYREKIETMHKSLVMIQKDVLKLDEGIKEISLPLITLSESVSVFYDDERAPDDGKKFRGAVLMFDELVRTYMEQQKQLYSSLEESILVLMGLKKRIQTRDAVLLDCDKWKTTVIKLTAKPNKDAVKLAEAEKKYEEFKTLHANTNEEVLAELKKANELQVNQFISLYNSVIIHHHHHHSHHHHMHIT